MFQYFSIPTERQERQKCYFFEEYVKVLYKDSPSAVSEHEATWVTQRFKDHAARIKEFPTREDDVWVASYPKTGTTLTCELVSVLLNGFAAAEKEDITKRVHFLEYNPKDHRLTEDTVIFKL